MTVAPDPAIEAVVGSWPAAFDNARATALGLRPDDSFEAVVRAYLEDHPEAVAAGVRGRDGA